METWVWFTACLFIGYFSPATCNVFPVKISTAFGNISKLCPRTSQSLKDTIDSTIYDAITNIVNPKLNMDSRPVCGCGGIGWTKVADVNMTNTNQQCPTNWTLYSSNGTRGCGRRSSTSNTCDSVLFPVNQNYSRVCGKIEAYQRGDADGFLNSINGISSIEQSYIDGVSVTYGPPGSRRHIWTFVSGDNGTDSSHRCSCSISTIMWPHQHLIPSFIGDNYFCENGNQPKLPYSLSILYPNLLWDGEGCTYPSTCCQFHNPPWFCVSLPQPTSDPIEVRLCLSEPPSNEDVIIPLVDLYVR